MYLDIAERAAQAGVPTETAGVAVYRNEVDPDNNRTVPKAADDVSAVAADCDHPDDPADLALGAAQR